MVGVVDDDEPAALKDAVPLTGASGDSLPKIDLPTLSAAPSRFSAFSGSLTGSVTLAIFSAWPSFGSEMPAVPLTPL